MQALLDRGPASGSAGKLEWLPIVAGLLLLYGPSLYRLAESHWNTEEGGHGPIILVVVGWLAWRCRHVLPASGTYPAQRTGLALLVPGLLFYVLGRSLHIPLFEIGSVLPVSSGILLAMRGWHALRSFWFPIVLVGFMIPLPGIFVDAITGPLKHQVSAIAEQILYMAGYPVARSGVLITIGQYQLLVADACAGLHSMFSLSALGLLFMYLTARDSVLHNAVMLASILPIAFAANIVRVLLLMLITYHLGDAAGQGFLHGATGIVLLVVALACLMALDTALGRLIRPHPRRA
jgi:exosortase B